MVQFTADAAKSEALLQELTTQKLVAHARKNDRIRGLFVFGTACVGVLRTVDVGNENAIRAQVKSLLNSRAIVVSAHADHGFGSAAGNCGQQGGKFLVARTMLCVHRQPVVAAVDQLLGDGRAMRIQVETHLGRASRSGCLKSAPRRVAADTADSSWV